MKTLMLAAAALTFGMGVASAQGVPQSLLSQQLGAPWAAKKLADEGAARDTNLRVDNTARPDRTANASPSHTAKN
jgi:hypothetical protein